MTEISQALYYAGAATQPPIGVPPDHTCTHLPTPACTHLGTRMWPVQSICIRHRYAGHTRAGRHTRTHERQQLCGTTHTHISNICSPLLRTLLRTQSYQGISAKHCTISNPDNRCTAMDQAVLCATCSNCPPTRAAIVNPYSSLNVESISTLPVKGEESLETSTRRDERPSQLNTASSPWHCAT